MRGRSSRLEAWDLIVRSDLIEDLVSSDEDRVEEPRCAIAPKLLDKINCKGKKGIEADASSNKRLSALNQNGYSVNGPTLICAHS